MFFGCWNIKGLDGPTRQAGLRSFIRNLRLFCSGIVDLPFFNISFNKWFGFPQAQNQSQSSSAGTVQASFNPTRPAEDMSRTALSQALDVNSGLSRTHDLIRPTQTSPHGSKIRLSFTNPGTSLSPRKSEVGSQVIRKQGSMLVKQAPVQTPYTTNSVSEENPEEKTCMASVHALTTPQGLSQPGLNVQTIVIAVEFRTVTFHPFDTNTGEEAPVPTVLHQTLQLELHYTALGYKADQNTGSSLSTVPEPQALPLHHQEDLVNFSHSSSEDSYGTQAGGAFINLAEQAAEESSAKPPPNSCPRTLATYTVKAPSKTSLGPGCRLRCTDKAPSPSSSRLANRRRARKLQRQTTISILCILVFGTSGA